MTFVLYTLACLGFGSPQQQARPFGSTHAIVGAKIEIGDGRVIEKGDVLIRDGLIEAVGTGLTIPPDAEVLKGDGLVVFPGFIDAYSTKGLKLPDAVPDQDVPPDRLAEAPPSMRVANRRGVRPELNAADHVAFADADLTAMRKAGFTTALVAAAGGLINGTAAVVNLSGRPPRECVVRPDAGMCLALRMVRVRTAPGAGGGGGGGGGYPGTLLGYLADLRQTFMDVAYQQQLTSAFQKGGPQRPPYDVALTSLQPVLAGRDAALIEADTETDVLRAVRMAEEFHLKPIICGALEAWKHAGTLAQAHIPVIAGLKLPTEPKLKPESASTAAAKPGTPAPVPAKPETPAATPPAGKRDDPLDPGAKPAEPAAPEDPDAEAPEAARAENHRLWEERLNNLRELQKAGIVFALSTRGGKTPAEFWTSLRKIIKAGLPREEALKALSLNPARILGVDRQLGSIATGKVANLTVMSADFVDPKSETRYVYVDGWKFDVKLEKPAPAIPGVVPDFETGGAR